VNPFRNLKGLMVAMFIVALALLLWEVFVRAARLPVYILPAPSLILNTLGTHGDTYFNASLVTFSEAGLGLFFGTLAGVGLAALLSLFPRFEGGVMTLAILIKSTPLVAIAPLLTIWLGFGIFPKVIITALLVFFPVLVNVLSGLFATDAALLETFHSWNASRLETFWYVRLPHAFPYLFSSLKVSMPLALMGAVVAEWTGASGGLGYVMWLAYANLNLPFLFAAVYILALAGMLTYTLVDWFESAVIFWDGKTDV
jgi:NitT/TauT family transport system permease protein